MGHKRTGYTNSCVKKAICVSRSGEQGALSAKAVSSACTVTSQAGRPRQNSGTIFDWTRTGNTSRTPLNGTVTKTAARNPAQVGGMPSYLRTRARNGATGPVEKLHWKNFTAAVSHSRSIQMNQQHKSTCLKLRFYCVNQPQRKHSGIRSTLRDSFLENVTQSVIF